MAGWRTDRQQQIVEAAGHMRADGLALEGADETHHGGPRDGNGEMIGPEGDEAFAQGLAALNLGEDPGLHLLHISLVLDHGEGAGRRAMAGWGFAGSGMADPVLPAPALEEPRVAGPSLAGTAGIARLNAQRLGSRPLADLLHEHIGGIRQVGESGRGFGRCRELRLQPGLRVDARRGELARGRPQTEAVGGDEGGDGKGHRSSLCVEDDVAERDLDAPAAPANLRVSFYCDFAV